MGKLFLLTFLSEIIKRDVDLSNFFRQINLSRKKIKHFKVKKKCLFPTPNWPLENVRLEIFFGWFSDVFFSFVWLLEIMTGSFWHCSELVYTVLYDQKLLLDLSRNQICVIWTQHWSFAAVNRMSNDMLHKNQCGSDFFFIKFKRCSIIVLFRLNVY